MDTETVCANCEDYVDEPQLKRHGSGWRHVANNSVRCPGQGDDDTDDRAEPRERPLVDEGMEAARAFAQWHLGNPGWADEILDARSNPTSTWQKLAAAGMRLASERVAR